jgi:hypothetical protein
VGSSPRQWTREAKFEPVRIPTKKKGMAFSNSPTAQNFFIQGGSADGRWRTKMEVAFAPFGVPRGGVGFEADRHDPRLLS